MLEAIAFYTFCALTLAMFLVVVTTRNILYALSALAAGMIFVSAFFFLLGAEFLGVVQIVVYTGAVIALYAFAMMFFDAQKLQNEKIANPRVLFVLSGLGALPFLCQLAQFPQSLLQATSLPQFQKESEIL